MTDFEKHLFSAFEKKGLSPKSVSLYMKNLVKLNGGKPLTDFRFLEKPETVYSKISHYADTTKRSFIIAIVSALNLGGTTTKHKKLYNTYYSDMMNMNKNIKETTSKKTNEGLPTWSEINMKYEKMEEGIASITDKRSLTASEYDALLKFLIVSLYVLQPPRRNGDYLEMLVVPEYEKGDKKANYLDLSKMEFVYEKYKTSKSYGEQKFAVNPELKQVLGLYLKFHPTIPRNPKGRIAMNTDFSVPLLVYSDGKPLTAINAITRILNSALGKGIGSTQLRHIYLTSKYGDVMEEKAEDAEAMGHSVSQQGEYIYKNPDKKN